MGKGTKAALAALLVLLIAAAAGLLWASYWRAPALPDDPATKAEQAAAALVDQRPLQDAQKLAPLATTAEELALVQQALRIADQEVDLAFGSALQNAIKHPAAPTPQIKKLDARIDALQKRIDTEEDLNEKLTKATAAAKGDQQDKLQEQLDLLQAQLELDGDDLASAKQELINAGGDLQSLLQRMKDQHDASTKDTKDALDRAAAAVASSGGSAGGLESMSLNLLSESREWWKLHSKRTQIESAQAEVWSLKDRIGKNRDTLEAQIATETAKKPGIRTSTTDAQQDTAAAMSTLAQLADDQKSIGDIDRRLLIAKDLDITYGKWILLVQGRERTALREMLLSIVIILVLGVAMVLANSYVARYFKQLAPERRRLRSVSAVAQIAVQAVGVGLILLVVAGLPTQLGTVLAVTGAGCLVVLQDFILGCLGWFALVGKNGIQLGDWVEIEGVSGEVVEIGLLHTVLLETGNLSEGHPTGRRVSFVNSYAIRGHYFNFSTSGQWLWDELQVFIKSSDDPNPVAQALQKMVAAETAESSHVAEEEWKAVTSSITLQGFSAEPGVSVRPTNTGIEITVRYITRANERHDLRTRLYQKVIEMLQNRPGAGTVVASAATPAVPVATQPAAPPKK